MGALGVADRCGSSPHYLPVSTLPGAISIGVSDRLPEGGASRALNHMIANMGTDTKRRHAARMRRFMDSAAAEVGGVQQVHQGYKLTP